MSLAQAEEWLGNPPPGEERYNPMLDLPLYPLGSHYSERACAAAITAFSQRQSNASSSKTAPHQMTKDNTTATSSGPSVQLSPEQSAVLRVVKSGKNVFFTGSAGAHSSSY